MTSSEDFFDEMKEQSQVKLKKLSHKLIWPSNLWMGVTVEMEEYIYRIKDLKDTPAKIKFISFEPLLGSIKRMDLEGIDWIIVGGESGPKSRPMKKEWVIEIRDYALKLEIPFFFKQWGGRNKKRTGRLLEGKIWNDIPKDRFLLF